MVDYIQGCTTFGSGVSTETRRSPSVSGSVRGCTTFGSGVSTETNPYYVGDAVDLSGCTTFGSGVSTETWDGGACTGPHHGLHDLRLRGEY